MSFELAWLILVIVAFLADMGALVMALVRAGDPAGVRWMLCFTIGGAVWCALGMAGSVMFG